MAISQAEKYQEWLERLEIPITEQVDIERFKEYLRDEFGIVTDAQVAALWEQTGAKAEMEEHGIRPVMVTYPWGRELRYGVQGMPGLWGYETIRQIVEEEEWE